MNFKKKFEFLEHTADLKFIAYGKTFDSCFENSALAMFSAIFDLDFISIVEKQYIDLEAEDPEILLHDWLSELLFLFTTDEFVPKEFNVSIKKDKNYRLHAIASGEKFDRERHQIKAEVKAVTYHDMRIEKKNDVWTVQVLCDI